MFLVSSPLLLASETFIVGLLIGYFTSTRNSKKLKKRVLDLEQEMMDRDAELLRRESEVRKTESPEVRSV